ncbi:MAG: hypothetical protein C4297_05410 [Gemmataceae bacterium]
MAATVSVTCPRCKKRLQVPANILGKKILCKGCNQAFEAVHDKEEDEWGIVKAYGLHNEKIQPRCPYCAHELESEEQVVCLRCGYNLRTREKLEPKILEPVTFLDWTFWLLPGIGCVLIALAFGGVIAILWTRTPDLSPLYLGWMQEYLWAQIYGTVFCAVIIWFCLLFAFKRLVLNPRPPEIERPKKRAGND